MEMITYLLHKAVVRIKKENPSKSTSDCHTASDKYMLTACYYYKDLMRLFNTSEILHYFLKVVQTIAGSKITQFITTYYFKEKVTTKVLKKNKMTHIYIKNLTILIV